MAKSFVEQVMAKISGGDETKLNRFQKRTIKDIDAQIKDRKEKIEDIEDRLIDLKEEQGDAIIDIDMESIQTTDATKKYVPRYIQKQVDLVGKQRELEEAIKTANLEIEVFQEIKKKISNPVTAK